MNAPSRRRNPAIWLGPLLTFCGAVTYFTVFHRFASTRDFPWVNLPLVLAGVALSMLGLWRARPGGAAPRGRVLGAVGLVLSLALAGLFVFSVFSFSYRLPAERPLSAALRAPQDFVATDQHGQPFRLDQLRGRKIVLVFYRGHW